MTVLGRCEQTSVHFRTNDRPTKRPYVYCGKTMEFSGVESAWVARRQLCHRRAHSSKGSDCRSLLRRAVSALTIAHCLYNLGEGFAEHTFPSLSVSLASLGFQLPSLLGLLFQLGGNSGPLGVRILFPVSAFLLTLGRLWAWPVRTTGKLYNMVGFQSRETQKAWFSASQTSVE